MSPSFVTRVLLSSLSFLAVARASPLVTARAASSSTIPKGTNTACAIASKSSAQAASASPNAKSILIPYQAAFDCLSSVPNKKNYALDFIRGLRSYLAFQSDKDYLINPPSGYLQSPFDIDGFLNGIESRVSAGQYENELQFQSDIQYMLAGAHDGHLSFQSDIFSGFSFNLDGFAGLTSVSPNGTGLPGVYFTSDLVNIGETTITPVKGFTASPVTLIDGVNVADILLLDSWYVTSQDPDAAYNSLFYNLGSYGSTGLGQYTSNVGNVPYNASVSFTFANGTTKRIPYVAQVLQSLDGVVDEETAYFTFCYYAAAEEVPVSTTSSSSSTRVQTTATASKASITATASASATMKVNPNIPYFPYPVLKDTEDTVAGYYLNDTGYTDVAVLQINSFEGPSVTNDWEDSFVETITNFLASATWNKKKYLIIDLQGNGGGVIDLGTAAAARIFPKVAPNTKSNIVRQDMLDLEVYVATAEVAQDKNVTEADDVAQGASPFDIQYNLTPDLQPFKDVPAFLNGFKYNTSTFTSFFQANYTDPLASAESGFTIYSQQIADTATPFPAANVVILTDGYCASSCTVFIEHLKNQGNVRSIVLGGRPQSGPMQAVGGIKGSQVFNQEVFLSLVETYEQNGIDQYVPKDLLSRIRNSTFWAGFDLYPFYRTAGASIQGTIDAAAFGVNGRNQFRIGDTTNTPLQFVYEAADCRLWYDTKMLYDPIHLWKRVADVVFRNYTGSGPLTSPFCVPGSTGQPTSITGGWKQGTLGPQTPPKSAFSQVNPTDALGVLGHGITGFGSASQILNNALNDLNKACQADMGDKWLLTLICGRATS